MPGSANRANMANRSNKTNRNYMTYKTNTTNPTYRLWVMDTYSYDAVHTNLCRFGILYLIFTGHRSPPGSNTRLLASGNDSSPESACRRSTRGMSLWNSGTPFVMEVDSSRINMCRGTGV